MHLVSHVSKTATQEIVNGQVGSLVSEYTKECIKEVLLQHSCTLDDSLIADISDIGKMTNPLSALSVHGRLATN